MKNKKLAAFIAAAVLVFGGYTVTPTVRLDTAFTASAENYGKFTYEKVSGGVKITACDAVYGALEIPSKIGGAKVVAIGDDAFSMLDGITSVTIPNGVKEIGICAFSGCTGLKKVVLPASLKYVREAAFADCTSLSSLTVPDNGIEFESEAFIGCTSLKTVTLPFSVSEIGTAAFGFTISDDENAEYVDIKGFKLKCFMNSQAYIYAVNSSVPYEILDPDTPDTTFSTPVPADDDTTDGETNEKGDVNGDGRINVSDISLAAGQVKGIKMLSAACLRRADVNKDSYVNVTDISLLSAHVKGIRKIK
ncbi:MAG: dockerin [Ruminococcus albus]|nr:dockerin [Ruminococcus albus]